jgi:hypothetical protein
MPALLKVVLLLTLEQAPERYPQSLWEATLKMKRKMKALRRRLKSSE